LVICQEWQICWRSVPLANVLRCVITSATKGQIFPTVLKVHEMSTNQISRSYHEGIPSY